MNSASVSEIQNQLPESPGPTDNDNAPLDDPLEATLEHGIRQDNTYIQIKEAVRQGLSCFPKELDVKVSIVECQINNIG